MRAEDTPEVGQARDVVAFGQEFGRVLSDGRIVGRAEPFAKVFPSSRSVKRAVGVTAWAILEDIALDARMDVEGRLVAETNVRRIASNLGLSPNTVSRHLGRLRQHGFVLHEEGRDVAAGRFATARYVLDPAAALERFTVTPPEPSTEPAKTVDNAGEPCRSSCDTDGSACRSCWDTVPCRSSCDTVQNGQDRVSSAVSQSAGHRDLRHNRRTVVVDDQQQPVARDHNATDAGLVDRLVELGVERVVAEGLVAEHPAAVVADALDAVGGAEARKPAGWVVSAVRDGWEVTELAKQQRQLGLRRQRGEHEGEARALTAAAERERQHRVAVWAALAVTGLDADQLTRAIGGLTVPLALGRRSVPEVRGRLAVWAAAVHDRHPDAGLAAALVRDLDAGLEPVGWSGELPDPPSTPGDGDLEAAATRLRDVVARTDAATGAEMQEVDR
jgi:DNA-binding transcriptional ArsR family regulator